MLEEDDPEPRVFPRWLVVAASLIFASGAVLYITLTPPGDPPDPPGPLLGCYSTPNGPDILIDRTSLTVLQEPPLRIGSSVKFMKGWLFEIDRWLDYEKGTDGKIRIVAGSTNGQVLQISREGELASPISSFKLINRRTLLAIRYRRSAASCNVVREGAAL